MNTQMHVLLFPGLLPEKRREEYVKKFPVFRELQTNLNFLAAVFSQVTQT